MSKAVFKPLTMQDLYDKIKPILLSHTRPDYIEISKEIEQSIII